MDRQAEDIDAQQQRRAVGIGVAYALRIVQHALRLVGVHKQQHQILRAEARDHDIYRAVDDAEQQTGVRSLPDAVIFARAEVLAGKIGRGHGQRVERAAEQHVDL